MEYTTLRFGTNVSRTHAKACAHLLGARLNAPRGKAPTVTLDTPLTGVSVRDTLGVLWRGTYLSGKARNSNK